LVRLPAAVEKALEQARERDARQALERDLKESEYRLDLALEASELAVWEWNLANGEVRFSRHWWPILGYEPYEIPLRIAAWENLTQPDDLLQVRSMLAALVKGSISVLDVEYRMRAKSGQWRWIRSVGRVVERNAAGLAVRLTGTHGDVTQRKAAEQQLRDSEARYRGLIEQASDGILLTDFEGNFVMANARACELLRCSQSDLLQMRGSDTYLAEDAESHAERKKRVRAGEDLRYERMVRRKDGSAFPAEVSIKMLDNRLIQVIFHDITTRRAQEQKIARLSRIQAVLSGIISAIVRIRNRQELFREACRIIVERGGFTVGWIAVLNQGRLVPVAQAGLPIDFGDSSGALTPAGVAEVALHEKRPAFDNRMEDSDSVNIGQDTKRVRQAAIRLGAKSVIVLPLFVEGKTFGVLTLYAWEQDFFDEEEIKLLKDLAGDISFGLEFIAKEE
ncbi:MAG: PAS domain S-box protein, partial [Burkholderiales bacterium]